MKRISLLLVSALGCGLLSAQSVATPEGVRAASPGGRESSGASSGREAAGRGADGGPSQRVRRAAAAPMKGQRLPNRWAIVLDGPTVADVVGEALAEEQGGGRGARAVGNRAALLASPAASQARTAARSAQASLRQAVAARGGRVLDSSELLVNALYVSGSEADAAYWGSLPGVKYVHRVRAYSRQLSQALELVKAQQAWTAAGGVNNAGAGVRIAILDSGIDHNHPAFSDATMSAPSGGRRCSGDDCNFTNNKVIAARSYVSQLVYYFNDDTRPDDLTPRDRVGHGTAAAMIAAGGTVTGPVGGPTGTITGMAPRAYLGNYKIFGSPMVNDFTFDEIVVKALEDAFSDGMNIASLSIGSAALWAPTDRGNVCNRGAGVACDVQVDAVERAVRSGMTVVVSAGNSGDLGLKVPMMNSIESPGTAPSAITVGASLNKHALYNTVAATAGNAPAAIRTINAYFSDGPRPVSALVAPMRDVATLQDDGKACKPLTNGSLAGAIALIQRGDCTFLTKVTNAQNAGAVAAVVYSATGNGLFPPTGLTTSGIPMLYIGRDAGQGLRTFLAANADSPVSLDPGLRSVPVADDEVAIFSSQGPSIGNNGIKPDLVAIGTNMYVATQSLDPNGEMFDRSGFTVTQGTSFSAPMVAGAAALIRQKYPNATPAQIKSALVASGNIDIGDYDFDDRLIDAKVTAIGGGRLDASNAMGVQVVAEPATLSFGRVAAVPQSLSVRITNLGTSAGTVRLAVLRRANNPDANATIAVTPTTLNLAAGASGTATVTLSGRVPTAGSYEGALELAGLGVTSYVPFHYAVSDNQPFNATALTNGNFTTTIGGRRTLTVKVVDRFGLPVQGVALRYTVDAGGGRIDVAGERTDALGINDAVVFTGPTLGDQFFSVQAGTLTVNFDGRNIQQPTVQTGGIVNAASGQLGQGIAPGSYISIYGAGLAEAFSAYRTTYLPLALSGVSVGFDVPGQSNVSYPGRIHFVSPSQVNVQVPWELAGQPRVSVKVSLGDFSSPTTTVTLAESSPAFFEYTDPASGRRLIAALDQNSQLATVANPARRGQVVQLYANGLGPVQNQPASGDPASTTVLSPCRLPVSVVIGGRNAAVAFAGLAPGFVGLYQVNAVVPGDAPTGIQNVTVTAGGVSSIAASLPIQ